MPKGDLEKLCLKNIEIKDFYHDLPKLEYTLKEWEQFCLDNPDYLMVNHGPTVLQITAAISKGLDNIREVVSPLEILRAKFSRDIIIREQKVQYKHIYLKCLEANDFIYTYTDDKGKVHTYCLILDLLM
jgi:hypothetical protein